MSIETTSPSPNVLGKVLRRSGERLGIWRQHTERTVLATALVGIVLFLTVPSAVARSVGIVLVLAVLSVHLVLPDRLMKPNWLLIAQLPLVSATAYRLIADGVSAAIVLPVAAVILIALRAAGIHEPEPALVRNLAVSLPRHKPQLSRSVTAGISWTVIAIWWLTGVTLVVTTGWAVPLSAAIVTIVLTGIMAWRPLQHRRANRAISAALRAYAPVFAMPYGGGAIFHIEMWERFIRQAGQPYIIVTLQERTLDLLAEQTDVPVIVPAELSIEAIRPTLPPSVKAAFYVHNAGQNQFFFDARKNVTHVFLHHGDGDKESSSNPKSRKYDILLVAGQAAIDRYALRGIEIPRDKFVIGGRPQTEAINVVDQSLAELSPPTVLYAPTWAGRPPNNIFSSLPWGPKIIATLLDRGARVIFRPHPVSRRASESRKIIEQIEQMLTEHTNKTGIEHIHGPQAEEVWGVTEVTNESDAMISDVSGIVTDYLQSGKPFAMVSTKFDVEDFRRRYPTSRAAYVISMAEPDTLTDAVDDMLTDDTRHDLRWELRDYYLGGFGPDYTPSQAFVELLDQLAHDRPINRDPSGNNSDR